MTTVDDETLRTWAHATLGREAVLKMAADNPAARTTSKADLIEWLLVHEREMLAESYRIETVALAGLRELEEKLFRAHAAGDLSLNGIARKLGIGYVEAEERYNAWSAR